MTFEATPSELTPTPLQTVGPYFGLALTPNGSSHLVLEERPDSMTLSGRLTDGAGMPVKEGLIEIWQADGEGVYSDQDQADGDHFTGFGACHAGDDGAYEFITIKPGPVPAPGAGMQAPHISVAVHGLGILKPLHTRIYFSDEEKANAKDPILSDVAPERRPLLIARVEGRGAVFDISLQGMSETPFFAL